MIKVSNELPNYDEPVKPSIRIHAHWNNPKLLVIWLDDETSRTVAAADVIAAVQNATNTNRHG